MSLPWLIHNLFSWSISSFIQVNVISDSTCNFNTFFPVVNLLKCLLFISLLGLLSFTTYLSFHFAVCNSCVPLQELSLISRNPATFNCEACFPFDESQTLCPSPSSPNISSAFVQYTTIYKAFFISFKQLIIQPICHIAHTGLVSGKIARTRIPPYKAFRSSTFPTMPSC